MMIKQGHELAFPTASDRTWAAANLAIQRAIARVDNQLATNPAYDNWSKQAWWQLRDDVRTAAAHEVIMAREGGAQESVTPGLTAYITREGARNLGRRATALPSTDLWRFAKLLKPADPNGSVYKIDMPEGMFRSGLSYGGIQFFGRVATLPGSTVDVLEYPLLTTIPETVRIECYDNATWQNPYLTADGHPTL